MSVCCNEAKPFNLLINLDLTTVGNDDLGTGLTRLGTIGLDSLDHVHTLSHLAEDAVLAIEPWCRHSAEEELGAVGVRTSVRHGEDTCTGNEAQKISGKRC